MCTFNKSNARSCQIRRKTLKTFSLFTFQIKYFHGFKSNPSCECKLKNVPSYIHFSCCVSLFFMNRINIIGIEIEKDIEVLTVLLKTF